MKTLCILATLFAMLPVSTVKGADLSVTIDDGDPLYHDVPTGNWTYAAVERLSRRNVIRFYPFGYFSGKPVRTRFEFAVAILRSASMFAAVFTPLETSARAILPQQEAPAPPGTTPPAEDLKLLRRLHVEFKAQIVQLGGDWKARDNSLQKLQDQGLHQELALALAADIPKTEDAAPGIGFKVVKRPNWAYDSLQKLRHTKEASQVPEDRLLSRDEFAGIIKRAVDAFLRAERTPDPTGESVSPPPLYGLPEVIALHKLTHAFRFEIAPTGLDVKAVEKRLEQAEEKRITDDEIIDTKPPVP